MDQTFILLYSVAFPQLKSQASESDIEEKKSFNNEESARGWMSECLYPAPPRQIHMLKPNLLCESI